MDLTLLNTIVTIISIIIGIIGWPFIKNRIIKIVYKPRPPVEHQNGKFNIQNTSQLEIGFHLEENYKSSTYGSNSLQAHENAIILGNWYYNKGELNKAEKYFDDAKNYFRHRRKNYQLAMAYVGLASIYAATGNNQNTFHCADKVLKITDDKKILSEAKLRLGIGYRRQGLYTQALSYLGESLDYWRSINSNVMIGETNIAIGDVYRKQQNWIVAEEKYRTSLETLNYHIDNHPLDELAKFHLSQAKYAMSRIYMETNRYNEAEILLHESFLTLEKIGRLYGIEMCAQLLGKLYEKKNDWDTARHWYDESLVSTLITGNNMRKLETIFLLAQLSKKQKTITRAEMLASFGINDPSSNNFPDKRASILALLGNIYFETSFLEKANSFYMKALLSALQGGHQSTQLLFDYFSDSFTHMDSHSRKKLAENVITELIIKWPLVTANNMSLMKLEKRMCAPSKDNPYPKNISQYLNELLSTISN